MSNFRIKLPDRDLGAGQGGGVIVDPHGEAELGLPADFVEHHHAQDDGLEEISDCGQQGAAGLHFVLAMPTLSTGTILDIFRDFLELVEL